MGPGLKKAISQAQTQQKRRKVLLNKMLKIKAHGKVGNCQLVEGKVRDCEVKCKMEPWVDCLSK